MTFVVKWQMGVTSNVEKGYGEFENRWVWGPPVAACFGLPLISASGTRSLTAAATDLLLESAYVQDWHITTLSHKYIIGFFASSRISFRLNTDVYGFLKTITYLTVWTLFYQRLRCFQDGGVLTQKHDLF